ncbi:hypothetical protein LEUCIP111803_02045 [Leucobacter soli]|uniref:CYTH domain-containing protein n=1 Tax=Leucobacter soli TaxID=2812850 RepID=A0A916NHX0_9MICO|nr:hypothetical protein LEUCIP111803_02045 [Leucobacter soli]
MVLVLIGSIGVQISSALAYGLFDTVGAIGTSSARMTIAAVLVLLIFRPRLRGRSRGEWAGIVLYGVAMAASNILLYLAIDRIPLGIATTLDFLGPCVVALALSRRLREGLLALLAFAGVVLIAGLGGPVDALGLVFGAGAGAAFALYTVLAAHIGKSEGGMQSMALSVAVAAILTLPFAAPAMPRMEPAHWLPLVLSALLGTALAFTVDTLAGRFASARVIGVLFAFDPMIGTLVGALWLGQSLTLPALAGIVLVVVAGAGIVWSAGRRRAGDSEAAGSADPAREEADVASGESVAAVTSAVASPVESLEIERKYEVEDGAALPAAEDFAALGLRLAEPEHHRLEARYFDTPDGALAAQRVAVRMRAGGKDEGWHLKEKGAEGARELLWPPAEEMPQGLRAELERRIGADGARRLDVIGRLRTERTTVRVTAVDGVEVIELADDRVDATNELTGRRQQWREWEAELIPGADEGLLDRIEPLLIAAGAARVRGTSKIQRTMS